MPSPSSRPALLAGLFVLAAGSALPAAVTFTSIVTGLSAPTAFIDPPDYVQHRFITQQAGQILVWAGGGTTTLATPYLDLSSTAPVAQRKVATGGCCGERGLLSMTVHPQFASNGYFFVYYTSTAWTAGINIGDVVVERYTRSAGDPNVADFSTAKIILRVPHSASSNHNGGDIEFGPDGYLYVTIGDGGGSCDSTGHSGQDPNQLLGKMLRLDVDGPDAYPADPVENYAIPPDNPLVGVAGADEIWALGLRNPFRFSFDRSNGAIYIGDVGQSAWEEINYLPTGVVTAGNPVNFGWPCKEGFASGTCSPPPQGCAATFRDPVRAEPNTPWISIMGGYMYRGTQVTADLGGRYIYGDAGNSQVWLATPTDPAPRSSVQVGTGQGPYGFSEDGAGELYLVSSGGVVRCVNAGAGCPWALDENALWGNGFESGATGGWAAQTP